MTVQYDRVGTECAHGAQPGAKAMMSLMLERYEGSSSDGIFNCRAVRFGSTLSFHGEGRALDFLPTDADQYDAVLGFLLTHVEQYGIQEIIDYRHSQRWDSRRGWEHYTPHGERHIHFTLNWESAGRTTQPGAMTTPSIAPKGDQVPTLFRIANAGVASESWAAVEWPFFEEFIGDNGKFQFDQLEKNGAVRSDQLIERDLLNTMIDKNAFKASLG